MWLDNTSSTGPVAHMCLDDLNVHQTSLALQVEIFQAVQPPKLDFPKFPPLISCNLPLEW
jgi:hypothetical protein